MRAGTSPAPTTITLAVFSDGDGRADVRVRLIVYQLEVLEFVIGDRIGFALDTQARRRVGLARELQTDLLQVVRVDVAIAARPDELARREPALLGDHRRQ